MQKYKKVIVFNCVQPLKYQASAGIKALFNLNVNCETVFSCLDEKDVHLGIDPFCC